MDEESGSTSRSTGLPHGLAVRRPPADAPDLWYEVAPLPDGRLGLAVGLLRGSGTPERVASAIGDALRRGEDPAVALNALAEPDVPAGPALCAVIDRPASRVSFSSIGGLAPVICGPGTAHRALESAPGVLGTADLRPGDSLLLCTAGTAPAGAVLEECATAHPADALDRIAEALTPGALVAVLYRHPPGPLDMRLPAEPPSLAVVRNELRQWLTLAGVDAEDSADALLAVGEAASNAAEHSVVGVAHGVKLSIHASIDGDGLRFMVSDNGRWKPAQDFTGHRGHGIKLINALVDTADLTTSEDGTTVRMLKEMRP